MPVMVMPGRMAVAVVVPAVDALFPINPTRREIAGTAIGRALLDIVILRRRDRMMVLHVRIGQPLIACITRIARVLRWHIGPAARADIAARLPAGAASRRRRSACSHHGKR